MKIFTFDTYEEMSSFAADIFEEELSKNPACVLGLATGSTPIGLYKELVKRNRAGRVSFKKATVFNLDEYAGLPPTNSQSYKYFMDKNLFDGTDFKKENLHIPDGLAKDLEESAASYDSLIESAGGIDLQLLGIGLNGHIGFNEPAEYFTANTHVVELSESTIEANSRFFEKKEDVPRRAVTMGMKSIMSAKKILMIINGEKKHDIFERMALGPIGPTCPASLLQLHRNAVVLYSKK